MGQTTGIALANVGLAIRNLDVLATEELGKGVVSPEGICGCLLGKMEY